MSSLRVQARGGGGGGATSSKKQSGFKHALARPHAVEWPAVSEEACEEALRDIAALLPPALRLGQRDTCAGLAQVTRAMERGDAAVAVVARRVKPSSLVEHLPVLAHAAGVPLVVLPCGSEALGRAVGRATCVAVAVGRGHDAAEALLARAALPVAPWLPLPGRRDAEADRGGTFAPPRVPLDPHSRSKRKAAQAEAQDGVGGGGGGGGNKKRR